ncbi:MAG TPA: hypothetical protein VNT03_16705 [Baekduia sp.]|nr:hypothetical protein [Baekduia sp.]
MSDRPRLVAVEVRAEPSAWRAAGFAVGEDGRCRIGTTDVVLRGGEGGFAGWTIAGAVPAQDGLDGVPTTLAPSGDAAPSGAHPNGVVAIDHVVLATPDTARTFATLQAAGFALRRVADAGSAERPLRQGFFLFADVLLEVVGPPEAASATAADPAALWGITLVAPDLDAAAAAFGDGRLSQPRDAVQPGRRIAVVAREAALGVRVALMTPRS